MHLECHFLQLGAALAELVLYLQKLLAQVSILFISHINCIDIVFVLEAQIVQCLLQVFDICIGLTLSLSKLLAEPICLSLGIDAPRGLLLERDSKLVILRLQVVHLF